jgi:hypothetical protein
MLCGLAALVELADDVLSAPKETVDAAVLSIRNEIAGISAPRQAQTPPMSSVPPPKPASSSAQPAVEWDLKEEIERKLRPLF